MTLASASADIRKRQTTITAYCVARTAVCGTSMYAEWTFKEEVIIERRHATGRRGEIADWARPFVEGRPPSFLLLVSPVLVHCVVAQPLSQRFALELLAFRLATFTYSAPGGLRQDPGRAAESAAGPRTDEDMGARRACVVVDGRGTR